ncbi:MAG: UDP-N-acetylmuramate--L-alanine ligase [Fibrobacterota bacterium]
MVLNKKEQIHFIGIGGAGMFPMAEVLHRQGYPVTGSDMQESDALAQLRRWGIAVQIGHEPDLVRRADIVVHTSAVANNNAELMYARKQNCTVMKRAVMLGDLMRRSFSVGISGTHGKTTTTSILAALLQRAQKEPTVIVGGHFKGQNGVSGAMVGSGDILVAEADEYDRSFLQMYPSVAVVTNIEADHLDIYGDLHAVKDAFVAYIHRVPFYGQAVLCIDDPGVRSVLERIDKPVVTYGFSEDADFRVLRYEPHSGGSSFTLRCKDRQADYFVPLYGRHNVLNCVAAAAVAWDMGVTSKVIAAGLKSFPGVKRRMDLLGQARGVRVYDDYAHHPTEIRATLSALKGREKGRLFVCFQPHLFSRTAQLMDEFAAALQDEGIDRLIILPIYRAREENDLGISSEDILSALTPDSQRNICMDGDSAVRYLAQNVRKNDTVLLMGAGDVWKLGGPLLREID